MEDERDELGGAQHSKRCVNCDRRGRIMGRMQATVAGSRGGRHAGVRTRVILEEVWGVIPRLIHTSRLFRRRLPKPPDLPSALFRKYKMRLRLDPNPARPATNPRGYPSSTRRLV